MNGFVMFEVLSQPIVPGIPDVPYVQQGSFLQVTNTSGAATTVSLFYYPSPNFTAKSGAVSLFTNYIDNNGNVTMVPPSTFIAQKGFINIQIPGLQTFIFGVQYLLSPGVSTQKAGSTPQDGVATRGFIFFQSSVSSLVAPLGTIRQVFTNFTSQGAVQDVSEAAYAVPYQPNTALQKFEP